MNIIEPVTEAAKIFTKSCTDFMGETVGELIRDEVHLLRWKNANRVLGRAEKYLKERNAQGKKTIPLGLAIRFMDGASIEEEPSLQDMWARLLANAADPNNEYKISKTHITLISEFNALDAIVLEFFETQGWLNCREVAELTGNSPLDCKEIASKLNVPSEDAGLALGNLWRLGCLIQDPTYKSGVGPSTATNSSFRVSPLGNSLLAGVKAPSTKNEK